jgi:hypothetical protein
MRGFFAALRMTSIRAATEILTRRVRMTALIVGAVACPRRGRRGGRWGEAEGAGGGEEAVEVEADGGISCV